MNQENEIIEETSLEVKEEVVETKEATVIYKEVMHITAEDMKAYNLFVYGRPKGSFMMMLGVVLFLVGIVGFIQNKPGELTYNIIWTACGLVVVLYSLFVAPIILRKRIEKVPTQDQEPIEIQISEDGVFNKFESEEIPSDEPIIPFSWDLVYRVYEKEEYIYIQMVNRQIVMLVKKQDVQDINFIYFLKDKAQSLNKWVELKK